MIHSNNNYHRSLLLQVAVKRCELLREQTEERNRLDIEKLAQNCREITVVVESKVKKD